MEAQNLTLVAEFHLMSLSEDPELQLVICGLFLSIYLVTVLGNLLIILAVSSDSHLHTRMYVFLSNLSLDNIGFISSTVPKMIVNIQTHSRAISYAGCLIQISFFAIFGCIDDLLVVMANDRFVAICQPLRYTVIMNPRLCVFLVLVSFFVSLVDSPVHHLMVLHFPYFKDVEIANFFCNPSQILTLTCYDPFGSTIILYLTGATFAFLPILGIFFFYYKIISSVLRVSSVTGKYKAFSTCRSHLSVVCLFYGTGLGRYLSSAVSSSPRKYLVPLVMYTVATPMLNPFIYSLRNRDFKNVLKRLQWRTI